MDQYNAVWQIFPTLMDICAETWSDAPEER